MESEMEKCGARGYGPLCPAGGLQMALRIKSKLCWLPRNGLCDTSGATGERERCGEEGRETGPGGGGSSQKAAATERKSPSNEFLKYLKINCLWKKEKKKKRKSSTDSQYAGLERGPSEKLPSPSICPHLSHFNTFWQRSLTFSRLSLGHQHACRCWTNTPSLNRGQVSHFVTN